MVKRILALSLLMVLSSCATGADDTVDSLETSANDGWLFCCHNTAWTGGLLWVRSYGQRDQGYVCSEAGAVSADGCSNGTGLYGT